MIVKFATINVKIMRKNLVSEEIDSLVLAIIVLLYLSVNLINISTKLKLLTETIYTLLKILVKELT